LSRPEVAAALLMDNDTIRRWHKLFEQRGIDGLTSFDMGGSARPQEDASKAVAKFHAKLEAPAPSQPATSSA